MQLPGLIRNPSWIYSRCWWMGVFLSFFFFLSSFFLVSFLLVLFFSLFFLSSFFLFLSFFKSRSFWTIQESGCNNLQDLLETLLEFIHDVDGWVCFFLSFSFFLLSFLFLFFWFFSFLYSFFLLSFFFFLSLNQGASEQFKRVVATTVRVTG